MSESSEGEQQADPPTTRVSSDVFNAEEFDDVVVGTVEGSTIPDRDTRRLRDTLRSAQHGEEVELTLGTGEMQVTRRGRVVGSKGPRCKNPPHLDWEFALEVEVPLDEDEPSRIYRIGRGDDRFGEWFVFSYDYVPELGIFSNESETAHGWAIEVTRNP